MKICIFVANGCTSDSRVLRQGDTFARAGHETVIVAVKRGREPFWEARDGFEIRRVLPVRGGARALFKSMAAAPPTTPAVAEVPADVAAVEGSVVSVGSQTPKLGAAQWYRWIVTGTGPAPRSSRGREETSTQRMLLLLRVLAGLPSLVVRRVRGIVMRIAPVRRPLKAVKRWQRRWNLFLRARFLRGQRTMERQMARAALDFDADVYWANDANTLRAAFMAARRSGRPLFYDAHEAIWDAIAWAPIPRRRMAQIERRYVGRADGVFTVCRPIAKAMTVRYGIAEPKVILNCPRLDHTRAAPSYRESPINEFRGPGERLVLFHGGLSPWRGLEQLVQAMPSLSAEHRLVFMGPGRLRDELEAMAAAIGVGDRVTFIPGVPPSDLPSWLTGADVGVIPYQRRGKNHEYSTPNKLFECMHAGVPLVVNDLPEIRRIVSEVGFGVVVDCSIPAAIAEGIEQITNDPDLRASMSARARAAAETYSWERQEEIMLDAVQASAGRRTPERVVQKRPVHGT
jgi:glycosyltransferase involved in cell wall biosynthesis